MTGRTTLTLDGAPVPDAPGEIRACLVVRNEALRLPANLAHHRALGVDRFLVVDNGSTDGTLDYLAAQPDVCLFRTDDSFAAAECGYDWTNMVLGAHADGQWALTVDADELFVFPAYEHVGLRALCGHLDAHGARGVVALMVDMYGPGAIAGTIHDPGRPLTEASPWFDPGPYSFVRDARCPHVQFVGGVRARAFDFSAHQPTPPVVSKVPLVKWDRATRYLMAAHAVTPLPVYPMLGGLLHFKFLSDFPDRVVTAVAEAQHFGGAQEYRVYLEHLRRDPDLRLRNDASQRFAGSAQLLDLRLLEADEALAAFLTTQMA